VDEGTAVVVVVVDKFLLGATGADCEEAVVAV
jgi:hypothetical protein